MIKAIDISKHQGTFDAAKAKAAGVQSVILRAGYGNFQDVKFDTFAAACRGAGLPFGAYQFLTWHYKSKNNSDPAQARTIMRSHIGSLIETLKGSGLTGWVALDQEMERGQEMGLSPAANTQLLNEAAQMLRDAGYSPCVYTGAAWGQSRIQLDKLNCPVWIAYYYADPNDPDFGGCRELHQLGGRWGKMLQDLDAAGKICGWQYGRIGYGAKYGVGSANVDRDWMYLQPKEDKNMIFIPITGKQLRVLKAKDPACQAFGAPDVNSPAYTNLALQTYPITEVGDTVELGGMTATWYKITGAAQPYVLALPDRCTVEDAPKPEPKPEPEPRPEKTVRVTMELTAPQLRKLADMMEGKA